MLNCINFIFKRKRERSIFPEEIDTVVPTNKTKFLPHTELNKNNQSVCQFYGTCDKSNK